MEWDIFSISSSRSVQKDNDSIRPSVSGRYWGRIIGHLKIMEAGLLITLTLLRTKLYIHTNT